MRKGKFLTFKLKHRIDLISDIRFLKRFIFIFCFTALACHDERSKTDIKFIQKISNGLYVEVYRVYGSGAFGGDLLSHYLTDSTNFRIYIGTFDDYDRAIVYQCAKDSVYATKIIVGGPKAGTIVENWAFDVNNLKIRHKME